MTHQFSLFDDEPVGERRPPIVPDLRYEENHISPEEHDALLHRINGQPWITDLKRRVQHYGYRYDYKARQINLSMHVGALPSWLQQLAERLHTDGYIGVTPDQVIVNEYTPGQGIADHIDCEPCFGDTIISLSLGSGCIMQFTRVADKQRVPIWLAPRSIVVLSGEARRLWTHGIPARKSDEIEGRRTDRSTRVSLTFRKVILD